MASLARMARSACAQATRALAQQASGEGQAARSAIQQCSTQTRNFAAGGHGNHHDVTHAGLTLHAPARWHVVTGKAFASLMWFWVFYRFYNDYDTFLFGHAQHFEHELHSEEGEHEDKH